MLASCSPTRRLKQGEYLLKKNEIKFEDDIKANPVDILETVRQKPNRKLLGFIPFYLWAYNVPDPDKFEERNKKRLEKHEKRNDKRAEKGKAPVPFKPAGSWWRETVGEPPVVFDSTSTIRSEEQIKTYLIKHGWFNAEVQASIHKKGKREKAVTYHITGNQPYHIRRITFNIPDKKLEQLTLESRAQRSNLTEGQQFNIDKLDTERERLNSYFRNRGYFNFNKELIYFDVDSNLSNHQVDLTLGIVPRKVPSAGDPDSLLVVPYKRYKVRDIRIVDNPSDRNAVVTEVDTVQVKEYTVIDQHQLNVKPRILGQNILFKPNDYYQIDNVTRTYRRLSSLPIVGGTRIQFIPLSDDIDNRDLNCLITVTPAKKQNFSLEWKGTNRGGFLGIAGSAGYQNKNIFGGAEKLDINISGGVEAQQLLTSSESGNSSSDVNSNLYFNTLEFGPEVAITFPKFLLPIKSDKFAKSADPKTTLRANLSYQRRPDYERTRSFGSIAYGWSETDEKKWMIAPLEVSLIKIFRSEAFDRQLEEIGDPFLINSFQDHFIVDTRIAYTLNTQTSGSRKRNFWFYHAEVESAGNVLRGLFNLFDAPTDEDGNYEILDINFAQYLKTLHDLRYYRIHNPKMSTAYRISGGIGVPFENLNVLPFEKSFFGGGANDIRAWQARTLGPGSYRDPERNFDKIGDILIEANVEYRFNLIDVLEGALFVDAGNIWTIQADDARPGADFETDRFLSEIAVGAGVGARLNFDFFLIRLDLALQLKDPALDRGERWLFQPKDKYNEYIRDLNEDRGPGEQLSPYAWRWNINIGIGYPF